MGKIVLEDFYEGNGHYKVNLAYLNKEQVKEIESLVSKWKQTDEYIKSCIEMCLTDANEQRFKDYGTNLKDCLDWLEKQSNTSNKSTDTQEVEIGNGNIKALVTKEVQLSKFNVGDWITLYGGTPFKIIKIEREQNGKLDYLLLNATGYNSYYDKKYVDENFRLWSIQDAKDGEVLQLGKVTAIFKEYISLGNCKCYCSVCEGEFEIPSQEGDNNYGCHNATSATKEQRYQLEKAMTDAGYTFDFKKKKLEKIEQKSQRMASAEAKEAL